MEVPRHFYFPADFEEEAYEDKAFPIAAGQTISQPYTVAYQTILLKTKPGDRILEIGTGSGYQAAILHALGCEVFTIERQKELYEKSLALLSAMHLNITQFWGDGTLGFPEHAPFQGIIVTAGAPDAPHALLHQLSEGGRLVIPSGSLDLQQMCVYERGVENKIRKTLHGQFKFVPLIGKEGWKEA